MASRKIRKAVESYGAGYPSLKEHLLDRRGFLKIAGTTLAATGLLACGRNLGTAGSDGGVDPDARSPEPDAEIEIPGGEPIPNYYNLRIPLEGELTAYLLDGGSCTFFVEMSTYDAGTFDALHMEMEQTKARCRSTLEDLTYDDLDSAEGVASAEDDLMEALNGLARELNNHDRDTVEAVTLTILYLTPEVEIDGDMPMPGYP